MQEEQPLSQTPQRGGAKLSGARLSLSESVGNISPLRRRSPRPWAPIPLT